MLAKARRKIATELTANYAVFSISNLNVIGSRKPREREAVEREHLAAALLARRSE
jgi:hypothetical protein